MSGMHMVSAEGKVVLRVYPGGALTGEDGRRPASWMFEESIPHLGGHHFLLKIGKDTIGGGDICPQN